jgi:hypothetical protein
MDRAPVRLVTIESGPRICIVEGLGTLMAEETHSVAAGTDGHARPDLFAPGAPVQTDSAILQLST